MTAQTLLKDLINRSAQLIIVDNQLKVRAPKGVLTDEIKALLTEHKLELMDLISNPASQFLMHSSVNITPQERPADPASADNNPSPESTSQKPDLSGEDVGTRLIASAEGGDGASAGCNAEASVAHEDGASTDNTPSPEPTSQKPDLSGEDVGTRLIASVGCGEEDEDDEEDEEDRSICDDPYDMCSDVCKQCGAEVEYYSDLGDAYCKSHRFQSSWQQCQASSSLVQVTQEAFFAQDIAGICAQLQGISGPIALDLETTGLSPSEHLIVSISLGMPDFVFVIDMRPYYSLDPDRQAEWRTSLSQLFDSRPDIVWIGHNIKFDWSFLAVHFGIRLQQVYDVMLAEQILRAEQDAPKGFYSLLETAERYGLKVNKEQRKWFVDLDKRASEWKDPFPAHQLVYIVQDIEKPCQIVDLQRPLLAEHELEKVVQLENQAVFALALMEMYGILVDKDGWERILKDKWDRKVELEQELIDALGNALYASREQKLPKQVLQYERHQQSRSLEQNRLMREYNSSSEARVKSGWDKFYNTGLRAWDAMHPQPISPQKLSRAIKLSSSEQLKEALAYLGIEVSSTSEEALEPYVRQHPVIEQLIVWHKLNHFCQAFGNTILAHIKADGRIHASFLQAFAVSGRITCRGPNLQQIPKQLTRAAEGENVRRCFIAPEGSRILTADLSNIELRILAEISGDATILALFAQGKDMHAETARAMFDLAADIDTREYLYKGIPVRDIAKTINFGLIYGMGVPSLARRIAVSVEDAKKLVDKYFATYAGINKWSHQIIEQTFKDGYAVTLGGRKRFFGSQGTVTKGQRAAIERAARNHPIQGTNADILKRALALLYQTLPECVHLLLCVHDEIVLECPVELVEDAERTLKEVMMQACRDFLKVVAIPEPEVVVGQAWSKK